MNRYWFRPKKYGIGAFPSRWEGWAILVVFAAFIGGSGFVVAAIDERMTTALWLVWFFFTFAMFAGVAATMYWKTDGEWRWRGGKRGWLN